MMEYRPNTPLANYRVGSIVVGVPVSHPAFDGVRQYGARCMRMSPTGSAVHRAAVRRWRSDVADIVDHYNPKRDDGLYWCARCGRIEDGTHRFAAHLRRGTEAVTVKIGGICYKMSRRYGDDDHVLAAVLISLAEAGQAGRDPDWARACREQKWPIIGPRVDFLGRSYLDVGCQSGFSALAAYRRGASPVLGIDVRDKPLAACAKSKTRLGVYPTEMEFENRSAEDALPERDIVSCMGLLHYFPRDRYEVLIARLGEAARDVLIVEVRVSLGDEPVGMVKRGSQILVTERWLRAKFEHMGFAHVTNHVSNAKEHESRQVWIGHRKATRE